MAEPLLELTDLWREYPSGDGVIAALKGVNLTIRAGEMVAVVGQSGSGKSTLMNILGCLDRPSRGAYCIAGRDTSQLDPDELAQLRREHFGFIFQRYHLMNDLSALDNVEIPAVYAGVGRRERRERAKALLTRLGLAERIDHQPSQLSGGQQQRVSIARALINGGEVILADEPTGALDSQSGGEMMQLLEELNADGHTVIIVTHDMQVAEHAHRIIEIKDGEIFADRAKPGFGHDRATAPAQFKPGHRNPAAFLDRLSEAARMAVLAMNAHKLRAFLTMLGIIIGIASVVSVVALGEGTKKVILKQISAFGTNTIDIYRGKSWGDPKVDGIHTLTTADAEALAQQGYVDSVTPVVWWGATLRYRDINASAAVTGVGEDYFRVHAVEMTQGAPFDRQAVIDESQDVVIDDNTATKLFGPGVQAVGALIQVGAVPCRVVGVEAKQKTPGNGGDASKLSVWVPYTTVLTRMVGHSWLSSISVRLTDSAPSDLANADIIRLLTLRHRTNDVFTFASDFIKGQVERTTAVLTLLMSTIALISLLVGGIGVMNIMLVSVTERIKEIGVRSAVGARRSDILSQFLIEAVLVCLVGGALGVGLALLFATVFDKFAGDTFVMEVSPASVVVAFVFSSLIGVGFGFMPARSAARLDPVEALARE